MIRVYTKFPPNLSAETSDDDVRRIGFDALDHLGDVGFQKHYDKVMFFEPTFKRFCDVFSGDIADKEIIPISRMIRGEGRGDYETTFPRGDAEYFERENINPNVVLVSPQDVIDMVYAGAPVGTISLRTVQVILQPPTRDNLDGEVIVIPSSTPAFSYVSVGPDFQYSVSPIKAKVPSYHTSRSLALTEFKIGHLTLYAEEPPLMIHRLITEARTRALAENLWGTSG
jgi:hypothetical protein